MRPASFRAALARALAGAACAVLLMALPAAARPAALRPAPADAGALGRLEASLDTPALVQPIVLTRRGAIDAELAAHARTLTAAQQRATAAALDAAARRGHVDPLLVLAVMGVESSYNHLALSPVGAEGLMQLMPATAAGIAPESMRRCHIFEPAANVRVGARYLAQLGRMFPHDRIAALTAYNRGPEATRRILRSHNHHIPRAVAATYATRVLARYTALHRAYGALPPR